MTFNLGDEAMAGLIAAQTAINNATGNGRGYTARQAYDARMAVEAARREAYERAHPIESQLISGAGEVVQGFIPGGQIARGVKAVVVGGKSLKAAVAAEKARSRIVASRRAYETMSQAARREAGKGAVSGAVSGWGGANAGERTRGAFTGAVAGSVVGGATPYVERGARQGGQAAVRAVTGTPLMPRSSRQAANVIEDSIRADGISPRWVRTPQQPEFPMDAAGENLRSLAVTAANAPGPARNIALSAIADRSLDFPEAPLTTIDIGQTPDFDFHAGHRGQALFQGGALQVGRNPPEGRLQGVGVNSRLQPTWGSAGHVEGPGQAWSPELGLAPGDLSTHGAPALQGDRFTPSPALAYTDFGETPLVVVDRPAPAWRTSTRDIIPEPTLFGGAPAQAPQHLLPQLSDRATNARLGEGLFGDAATLRRLLDQKSGQLAYDQVDRWAPRVVGVIDDLYGTDDRLADLFESKPPARAASGQR